MSNKAHFEVLCCNGQSEIIEAETIHDAAMKTSCNKKYITQIYKIVTQEQIQDDIQEAREHNTVKLSNYKSVQTVSTDWRYQDYHGRATYTIEPDKSAVDFECDWESSCPRKPESNNLDEDKMDEIEDKVKEIIKERAIETLNGD